MPRGKYIVLEGDEGAGKTTQTQALKATLKEQGIEAEIVREPGSDPLGEDLRHIIKHAEYAIHPSAELLAVCSARANLIEHHIKPALEKGAWVIADRSFITSYIYQGVAGGLGKGVMKPVIEFAQRGLWPDLLVILDVTTTTSVNRRDTRGLKPDRFDRGEEWHQTVNTAFRQWPSSDTVKHVDGGAQPEAVTASIMKLLEDQFGLSATLKGK
jgi:dTMP kinase